MADREFVDENLPWPLWRPILGTLVGASLVACWCLGEPIGSTLPSSMYGAITGRTGLVFALLYFPAFSRRGWPWRLTAFALIFAAGAVATQAVPRTQPPAIVDDPGPTPQR